jgi:misacylated tRNA(Ala) deacylase
MTDLICLEDAYLREFEARVVGSEEQGIALDRTAFYPGGGGQPADRGVLVVDGTEHAVTTLTRAGDTVLHHLDAPPDPPPAAGILVHGRIDWSYRFDIMRTHTALHVLSAVIWRDWQCQVTGSAIKPLAGRMDFEFEGMPAELAAEIVRRANVEVEADREVRIGFLAREEADRVPDLVRTKVNLLPAAIRTIRTVEIVGLDFQADGGTHVARTGEIGHMRLQKHESKGRINKRLRIVVE